MEASNYKKKRSTVRRSRQQILQLLKEFDSKGLTITQFCELHHIQKSNFYKWQKRYGSKQTQNSAPKGFLAVELTSPAAAPCPTAPALFAEVNGIRLYQPVSALYLKTLLP
jgi:Transposase